MRATRSLSALLSCVIAVAARAQSPAPAHPPTTSLTADLGLVSASGNTRLRTLSAGDKLVHTAGRWAFSQLGAYVYGEANAIASANQLRAALRADYALENRLAAFASAA